MPAKLNRIPKTALIELSRESHKIRFPFLVVNKVIPPLLVSEQRKEK